MESGGAPIESFHTVRRPRSRAADGGDLGGEEVFGGGSEADRGGRDSRTADDPGAGDHLGRSGRDVTAHPMTQLSWDEEKAQAHLEVRSEGDWVTIKIEGDVARSQKDWVYWRLPTCVTKQAVSPAEGVELAVRLEKGEARVGLVAESVKPGENWHEEKLRDAAFFLDPFLGLLSAGDRNVASGNALKASQGDTISVMFHPAEAIFLVNSKEVGRIPIAKPRPMMLAAQMWDKGSIRTHDN